MALFLCSLLDPLHGSFIISIKIDIFIASLYVIFFLMIDQNNTPNIEIHLYCGISSNGRFIKRIRNLIVDLKTDFDFH